MLLLLWSPFIYFSLIWHWLHEHASWLWEHNQLLPANQFQWDLPAAIPWPRSLSPTCSLPPTAQWYVRLYLCFCESEVAHSPSSLCLSFMHTLISHEKGLVCILLSISSFCFSCFDVSFGVACDGVAGSVLQHCQCNTLAPQPFFFYGPPQGAFQPTDRPNLWATMGRRSQDLASPATHSW